VVVINEAMARLYFDGQDPIGKRLSFGPGNPWMEIVGVTRDYRIRSLTERAIPHFDLPALQQGYGNFSRVLVRSGGDAGRLLPAVRNEVRAIDPALAVFKATTLFDELKHSIAPSRMAATLTGLFGSVALLLAAIGLYGVIAQSVVSRTREIGIRMALGAEASDVLRLVLCEGLAMVAVGLALGLMGAFAATGYIAGQLYGVQPTDPASFLLAAFVLAAAALLACWIPARRAAMVDPIVALRCE
jgi:hypothetical protein